MNEGATLIFSRTFYFILLLRYLESYKKSFETSVMEKIVLQKWLTVKRALLEQNVKKGVLLNLTSNLMILHIFL